MYTVCTRNSVSGAKVGFIWLVFSFMPFCRGVEAKPYTRAPNCAELSRRELPPAEQRKTATSEFTHDLSWATTKRGGRESVAFKKTCNPRTRKSAEFQGFSVDFLRLSVRGTAFAKGHSHGKPNRSFNRTDAGDHRVLRLVV